jgi:putative ABC transport system permease protein
VETILQDLAYGVGPEDPVILTAVSLTLLGAALLATYVPARRATRLNPMDSTRAD